MQRSVFATCPGCQEVLRIPATWADKAVKCKKCGSVVRSTGKVVAAGPAAANAFAFDEPEPELVAPAPFVPAAETPPTISAPPVYGPPPMQPQAVVPGGYQYGPPPGYPYPPAQPGYAPSPYGYGPPPGYPGAPPGYPYAPPAGYAPNPYGYPPQPQPQAFAPPAPEVFAEQPKLSPKRRYKKSNNTLKLIVMAAFFLIVAGGVAAAVMFQDNVKSLVGIKSKPKSTDPETPGAAPGATAATKPSSGAVANASAAFPRRMLFIGITKYLYCNTLHGGVNGGPTGNGRSEFAEAAKQLAFQFRVPTDKDNNQLFLLTDAEGKLASNAAQRPMLKDVVLDTVKRFADSSRGQDRVVFYFGGHATMKDGKAYLVPVEGDLNEVESLLPLSDFFAAVKDCPAQQKVVLFDVCRANTDGNVVRPGSEAMAEELEKALLTPTDGANIQVITACSAGQNAAELQTSDGEHFAGSAFLNALRVAAKQSKAGNKSMKPEDPLPVKTWVEVTKPILADYVGVKMQAPVPKLGGGELAGAVGYNGDEAAAKRFDFPAAPEMVEASKLKDVFALLDLKPVHVKSDSAGGEDSIEMTFPFQSAALEAYKLELIGKEMEDATKDADKFPLRTKTVLALNTIRDNWGGRDGKGKFNGIRNSFAGETSNNVKDEIKKEQIPLATLTPDLEDLVRELEALTADAEKEESKAWKASFFYALAQAKSRLAYLHEANLALGKVLTDSLPEQLDKSLGLQLVSVEKMQSKKEFRKFSDEAKVLYDALATEHKGTPWEVLAKRARVESLGLEWKAYMKPKETGDDDKMEMKKDK